MPDLLQQDQRTTERAALYDLSMALFYVGHGCHWSYLT